MALMNQIFEMVKKTKKIQHSLTTVYKPFDFLQIHMNLDVFVLSALYLIQSLYTNHVFFVQNCTLLK